MNKFEELGLSAPVIKAISALGIENPTQIQQEAIPHLLQSKCDFIGLAHTGTGKTAAFGLPLVELTDRQSKDIQALIVVPTRELGQQVAQQLTAFAKGSGGINVQVVFGGNPIMKQMKDLRQNPQILVATPGRLIDLINRKAVKLDHIQRVILDEADEMLNMGFQEDIDKILTFTPAGRNIWLFSATMPPEIRKIVQTYMNNPVEVSIKPHEKVNQDIDHQFFGVMSGKKNDAIRELLFNNPDMRAVVFCRTRRDTDEVALMLRKAKISADAIHGDLSQGQRDKAMRMFKSNKLQTLVATDVAARGIDVNDVTHVIHHSLPDDMAFYTHRAGRTARAGKKGISMAIISRGDIGKIQQIERKLNLKFSNSPLFVEDVSEVMDMSRKMQVKEFTRGGRSGGGGFKSKFSRPESRSTSYAGANRDNQRSSDRKASPFGAFKPKSTSENRVSREYAQAVPASRNTDGFRPKRKRIVK